MTQWRSLDDILDAFSLTKPSSFPTARAELLRLLADIHPDRNSGQFNEKRYYEIRDAMDYLEKSERTSPQNLPATYESTSQLPARWQAIKATESNLSRSIEQRTKAKFRQTKIASAVVGGLIAAILGFSGQLTANPLISKLFSYLDAHFPAVLPVAGAGLIAALLVCAIIFIRSWRSERRSSADTAHIMSDEGLSELFHDYSLERTISETGKFSSRHILKVVQSKDGLTERWLHKLVPPIISKKLPFDWRYRHKVSMFTEDPVLAQQVTDLILEKLELREAISSTEKGAFFPIYQLSDAARDQLYG